MVGDGDVNAGELVSVFVIPEGKCAGDSDKVGIERREGALCVNFGKSDKGWLVFLESTDLSRFRLVDSFGVGRKYPRNAFSGPLS